MTTPRSPYAEVGPEVQQEISTGTGEQWARQEAAAAWQPGSPVATQNQGDGQAPVDVPQVALVGAQAPGEQGTGVPAATQPFDTAKKPSDLVKEGLITDATDGAVERVPEVASANAPTRPTIEVGMQDQTPGATPEKPNFVITKDGEIKMLSDPEATGSKKVTIVLERDAGQLNPTEQQQAASDKLVTYLSDRMKQQFPDDANNIELNDKDNVVSAETETKTGLKPKAEMSTLPPETQQAVQESNRFRGTGGGVDQPMRSTDNMGSFGTRSVDRQASETDQQAWTKEAIAGLFKPDAQAAYETVRKSENGYRVGRYGFSGDQLASWFDGISKMTPEQIQKLIDEGKLPKDFAEKMKDPEFMKSLKGLIDKIKSGEGDVSAEEMKSLLPKELQEGIASQMIDQFGGKVDEFGATPQNRAGAISAAMLSGKAPEDITAADLQTPESKQVAQAGQTMYDVAERRDKQQSGSDQVVGEVPEGERRNMIAKALELSGVPVNDANLSAVNLIIQHESNWNPNAQNNWDINAQNGVPSQGLMQTIPPTFNAHKLPGYDNIRDPLSNIIAGVRYSMSRYGSLQNVPGVRSMAAGGGYKPY